MASPKSSTFTVPSPRTLTFAGFKSRWTIPSSCAASSASAICLAIGNASSIEIAPPRNALREILALDEFHHQGVHPSGFLESVDRRDVRVIQRGEGLRLAFKSGQPLGVLGKRVGQDLDRHLTTQRRVRSPIHLAHAAFPERRGDLVNAETGAGGQGQR